MPSLVKNTYYNIGAFGINALVGICTIPFLVKAYGVEGYGLIVLARLLLPSGLLGLLECGLPEMTTRYVASALARGKPLEARRNLTANMIVICVIGLVCMTVLLGLAELITTVFLKIPPEYFPSFQSILIISALSLPLHFSSSVLRGAIEGIERFDLVRSAEVISNMIYFAAVLVLTGMNAGYEVVAIAYVVIWNLRAVIYLAFISFGRPRELGFTTDSVWSNARPMMRHAWSLFYSKLYATLLNFGPSVVLAVSSGAATVGSYDIVMRIPKLMKTVSGMFNGALLPYISRLDAINDSEKTKQIIYVGSYVVMGLIIPLSAAVIAFSGEIVVIWLGLHEPSLPIWLSVAMTWPMMLATFSIGSSILVARHGAVKTLNRINLLNLCFYFGVAFFLLQFLAWHAFVIALVCSSALTLTQYWRAISLEYQMSLRPLAVFAFRLLVCCSAAVLIKFCLLYFLPIDGTWNIVIFAIFWSTGLVGVVLLIVLKENEKKLLKSIVSRKHKRSQ